MKQYPGTGTADPARGTFKNVSGRCVAFFENEKEGASVLECYKWYEWYWHYQNPVIAQLKGRPECD
eukprot:3835773-Rhodomonas_salina.2